MSSFWEQGQGGNVWTPVGQPAPDPISFEQARLKYRNGILEGVSDRGGNVVVPAYVSVTQFGAKGDGVTDDTEAIQAALADAAAIGATVEWPAGDYVVSASVLPVHAVRHRGDGAILLGSERFWLEPKRTQTNRLYVSPGGSNLQHGMSPSAAFLTFQAAFDALRNYGPLLEGTWEIVAASGTYTLSGGQQTLTTPSRNRVIVRGPAAGHPNVPTAIIDGGGNGGAYAHGLAASGVGVRVEFRDLLVQNFTQTSGNERIGLLGDNECDFFSNNVHTASCSWAGIYIAMALRGRVAGGIVDGGGIAGSYGIAVNDAAVTVGHGASSIASGPVVRQCGTAVYWSRGAQGHVDYSTIEDCDTGVHANVNSRVHVVGSDFRRNALALRASNGAYISETSNEFNAGGADANVTISRFDAFSGAAESLLNAQSYARFAYDRATRSASGAGAFSFPVVYTLPAHRLVGVGKSVRVRVLGVYTVTAGSAVVVNFGGMVLSFTVPGVASGVSFEIDAELMEVPGGYRAIGRLAAGLSQHRMATATAGFVVTSDSDISISGTLAGAGDSLFVYRTEVFVIG